MQRRYYWLKQARRLVQAACSTSPRLQGEVTDHPYRVLRFWSHDVIGNTNGVLELIAIALQA